MLTCYSRHLPLGISYAGFTRMASQIQRQMSNYSTYMVVGLGNIDNPDTRHNVGMQAVDRIAHLLGLRWTRQRTLQSMVATANLNELQLQLVLVKPKTFMNINGKSIYKAAQHYGLETSNIYLMHDELDKPVGVAKMKNGGSARGHNGVRSAISSLKSDVMPRLLIGIDRPASQSQVAEYVLQRFKPDEIPIINTAIEEGINRLLCHIQNHAGIEGDLIAAIRKVDKTIEKVTDKEQTS